jgi:hypothetical protein
VQAETLVHARLLAAADKVARVYLFDAGFRVDPEFEQMIPDELIANTVARRGHWLTEAASMDGAPKMKARPADLGGVPMPMTSAEVGKLIADETEKWAKAVKFSGAKAE